MWPLAHVQECGSIAIHYLESIKFYENRLQSHVGEFACVRMWLSSHTIIILDKTFISLYFTATSKMAVNGEGIWTIGSD